MRSKAAQYVLLYFSFRVISDALIVHATKGCLTIMVRKKTDTCAVWFT